MTDDLKALAQRMKDVAEITTKSLRPGGLYAYSNAWIAVATPANVTALIDGFEKEISANERYQEELLEDIVKSSAEIASLREQPAKAEPRVSLSVFNERNQWRKRAETAEEQLAKAHAALDNILILAQQLKQCQEGK